MRIGCGVCVYSLRLRREHLALLQKCYRQHRKYLPGLSDSRFAGLSADSFADFVRKLLFRNLRFMLRKKIPQKRKGKQ